MTSTTKKIITALFAAGSVFLGLMFFVWTLFPYLQMSVYHVNFMTALAGDLAPFRDSAFSFYPRTFISKELNQESLDYMLKQDSVDPEFIALLAVHLRETIGTHDDDMKDYVTLGEADTALAELYPEKKDAFHAEADSSYEAALKLFPKSQAVMYSYAISLSNQGQEERALGLLKDALLEDPRVPDSHYYLGVLLYSIDNTKNSDTALGYLESSLSTGVDPLPKLTSSIYQKMLTHYYSLGDIDHVETVLRRFIASGQAQAAAYQKVLDYILENHALPVIRFNQGA